jgi:hypothetical protein
MRNITLWMMEGIAGIALAGVLGFVFTGKEMTVMAGVLGSIVAFLPFMQMLLTAKSKNFMAFFFNLKEENGVKKEKYLMYPGRYGRLGIIIAQIVSNKVLYVKGLRGYIDDKGTEYAFGNSPLSFWEPGKGFTTSISSSWYHHQLKKNKDIKDYDEMIKHYLTDSDYKVFCQKFRSNPEPNEDDIAAEIQWLKDVKNPADPLKITVFGETYSIHDDLSFMQYNYQPQAMGIYVENEKINVRKEVEGYKDPRKAMAWGKAAFIVILAIVILVAVLSSLDLSKLGSLFGGGK